MKPDLSLPVAVLKRARTDLKTHQEQGDPGRPADTLGHTEAKCSSVGRQRLLYLKSDWQRRSRLNLQMQTGGPTEDAAQDEFAESTVQQMMKQYYRKSTTSKTESQHCFLQTNGCMAYRTLQHVQWNDTQHHWNIHLFQTGSSQQTTCTDGLLMAMVRYLDKGYHFQFYKQGKTLGVSLQSFQCPPLLREDHNSSECRWQAPSGR